MAAEITVLRATSFCVATRRTACWRRPISDLSHNCGRVSQICYCFHYYRHFAESFEPVGSSSRHLPRRLRSTYWVSVRCEPNFESSSFHWCNSEVCCRWHFFFMSFWKCEVLLWPSLCLTSYLLLLVTGLNITLPGEELCKFSRNRVVFFFWYFDWSSSFVTIFMSHFLRVAVCDWTKYHCSWRRSA